MGLISLAISTVAAAAAVENCLPTYSGSAFQVGEHSALSTFKFMPFKFTITMCLL